MADADAPPADPTPPRTDWWRTDERPEAPEDPAVLQARERDEKKPPPHVILRRLRGAAPCPRVDLTTMELRDGCVVAVCRALDANATVERVYLGANYIRTRGWEAISGVVSTHPMVARWAFPKTRLGRRGVRALATAIQASPTCESVDLAGCWDVKEYGGQLLLTALKHNPRVTCLYVKDTDVPRDVVARIHDITWARRQAQAQGAK